MSDLNTRLIAAHDTNDKALLVELYAEAAQNAETPQEQAFFLTQAYVFALDVNHADADELRRQLKGMGRL